MFPLKFRNDGSPRLPIPAAYLPGIEDAESLRPMSPHPCSSRTKKWIPNHRSLKYCVLVRPLGRVRSSASIPHTAGSVSRPALSVSPLLNQLRRNVFHAPFFKAQNPATSRRQPHIV